jgi:hypothetical protein
VEESQEELKGNWGELEYNHSFVQWLFPIREQGVNYQAQPLELHEIDQLRTDNVAMERLIESFVSGSPPFSWLSGYTHKYLPPSARYRIMLGFYGLRLVDPTTGELTLEDSVPAPSPSSYLKRFENLERNSHNFLRITRILKCLNEVSELFSTYFITAPDSVLITFFVMLARQFGFPQHPPSLLLYILSLQSTENYLTSPSLVRSMDGYWKYCVRDENDRNFVIDKIEQVRSGEAKWSQEEYKEWIKNRAEERKDRSVTDKIEEEKEEVGEEDQAGKADREREELRN